MLNVYEAESLCRLPVQLKENTTFFFAFQDAVYF